ncbi:hypothetical protein [Streptomyces platensis]|uniref:hypothetical protein n=1 Tax=Streptomyces platensis TaxID=58346 RepID=UPI0033283201
MQTASARLPARLGAALAALLAVLGLCAPSAVAATTSHTTSVAVKKAGWDPWSIACASAAIPFPPAQMVGTAACGKKLLDKAAPEVGKKVVEGAASAFKPFADDVAKFTGDMIKTGMTWWLMTPSVRIEDTGVLGDPKKAAGSSLSLHAVMLGVGTLIAVLLTMFQGMRMIMQRKGQPFVQVLQGLLVNVLVNAVGVAVIDSLLVASDQLTKTIIGIGFNDHSAPERMVAMLLPAMADPGAVLLMALVVFLVGGAQVVLLFLRQAAIPFQALLLPIAGSGQVGAENTRQWLPRLITTILTVICYKPMAAVIISVGFIEMQHGNGIVDWLRGVVTLVLSVFALKGLMSLFAPIGMAMGGGAGGGGLAGGLMGMASSMGASAMTSGGSGAEGASGGDGGSGGSGGGSGSSPSRGGSSAQDQAAYMDKNGPGGGESSGAQTEAASETAASVPAQGAEATGTASTATSTGTAGTATSTGTATAAGGPVTIALVAAEAVKQGKDQAGNEMGNGGK